MIDEVDTQRDGYRYNGEAPEPEATNEVSCHGLVHWFPITDGEIALRCVCGTKTRQLME